MRKIPPGEGGGKEEGGKEGEGEGGRGERKGREGKGRERDMDGWMDVGEGEGILCTCYFRGVK